MKKSTRVSVNVNEHILKDKGCTCENYALLIVSMHVAMSPGLKPRVRAWHRAPRSSPGQVCLLGPQLGGGGRQGAMKDGKKRNVVLTARLRAEHQRVSVGKAWGQDTPPCKLGTVSSVGATG